MIRTVVSVSNLHCRSGGSCRTRYFGPVLFAAAMVLAACSVVSRAHAERLNVLLITADDLGLQLSCYGETLIETPRIDALAASGTRFQTAYVAQASCSPSRSSMFTGLHTHSTGQFGLTNAGFSLHPDLRDRTIPNLLKKAGYRTGIIGKLHVAPESNFRFDFRPGVNTREVRKVAAQADTFLAENGTSPFFLMVNYSDPHAFRDPKDQRRWNFPPQVDGLPVNPLPPSDKTIFPFQKIDTQAMRVRTAGYYNAVQRLDDGVGMLLDVLKRHGHDDDTLVLFVGDHGPPFCRGKTTVYEAGIRIPFLVRWPGVSKPMASDALVSTIDLLPTILDATGVENPGAVHGLSLRPVVSNPDASWRRHLVAEFHFHGRRPFFPRRAIRDHQFKLIHNLLAGRGRPSNGIDGDPAFRLSQTETYAGTDIQKAFQTFADPPEFELYDLKNDPNEFHNLALDPRMKATQETLQDALMRYRQETGDPFLEEAMIERLIRVSKTPAGER